MKHYLTLALIIPLSGCGVGEALLFTFTGYDAGLNEWKTPPIVEAVSTINPAEINNTLNYSNTSHGSSSTKNPSTTSRKNGTTCSDGTPALMGNSSENPYSYTTPVCTFKGAK